jgi:hypothetical protein
MTSAAEQFAERLTRRGQLPSAAEAGIENRAFIAAVNRCATQRQELKMRFSANCEAGIEDKPFIAAVNRCAAQRQRQILLFPQPVKR